MMNICTYEQLKADPVAVDRIASAVFYAIGKSLGPRFVALWEIIPVTEKDRCGTIGLEAILAVVDDYTTPGCRCKYCTWKWKDNVGRFLMCHQSWEKLTLEEQCAITESCSE